MAQVYSPTHSGTWEEKICAQEFKISWVYRVIYEDSKNKINSSSGNNKIFTKPRYLWSLNSITVNNSEHVERACSASHAWHPRKGSFPGDLKVGEQGTYSVWWGTTSSWKNFLTLSRKMSCSVEKILLIPISVNFLAEGVSRRASAPEWEHLEETRIRKIKSTFTLDIQMNTSE